MRLTGMELGAGLMAVLVIGGAAVAGLPEALGAHPWWGFKTGLVGAVIGFALFVILAWSRAPGIWALLIGLAILVLAGLAAFYGKQVFVASIGDDAVAGRFWFIGWFGVNTGACLALAAGLAFLRRV